MSKPRRKYRPIRWDSMRYCTSREEIIKAVMGGQAVDAVWNPVTRKMELVYVGRTDNPAAGHADSRQP